jgi:hypothetical protein
MAHSCPALKVKLGLAQPAGLPPGLRGGSLRGALRTSIWQLFQQSSHVNVRAREAGDGLTN